ncbi:MAG: hypothetical protein JNN06_06160 [Gemmobacter sp.]|uniref:DUF6484 domain-containing protein n=1 Tax=Gemmobacter sp. TaxID=1898957 RepID=UPI001A5B221F|nr:DUF6484 domain-containing protein [Gemmobacter sp.]MBL8561846.1 hypothetical protein [Gemmobacter sp.]
MPQPKPAPLSEAPRIEGVVVGHILSLQDDGPLVSHPLSPTPVLARSLSAPDTLVAGDAVALMFEAGDPARPIVMGRMAALPGLGDLTISSDAEQTVISHPRKLVLRCGKASVSLDAEGRVQLRGEYLLSLARGVNRIAGGAVKVN